MFYCRLRHIMFFFLIFVWFFKLKIASFLRSLIYKLKTMLILLLIIFFIDIFVSIHISIYTPYEALSKLLINVLWYTYSPYITILIKLLFCSYRYRGYCPYIFRLCYGSYFKNIATLSKYVNQIFIQFVEGC